MVKVGDKVLHNATSGDVIKLKDNKGKLRTVAVADTWPNGIRIEMRNGDCYKLTYREVEDRSGQFVHLREKAKL